MSGLLRGLLSYLPCCARDDKVEVDDSNVDAVIARNLWKNHRILPPTSKNKQHWDLIMVRPANRGASQMRLLSRALSDGQNLAPCWMNAMRPQ